MYNYQLLLVIELYNMNHKILIINHIFIIVIIIYVNVLNRHLLR